MLLLGGSGQTFFTKAQALDRVVQQRAADAQGHLTILHPVVKCNDLSLRLRQAWIGTDHNLAVLVPVTV